MQLQKFTKVVQKYPKDAENISLAFNKAMTYPNKPMEEILAQYKLELDEKSVEMLKEDKDFALQEIKKVPY